MKDWGQIILSQSAFIEFLDIASEDSIKGLASIVGKKIINIICRSLKFRLSMNHY